MMFVFGGQVKVDVISNLIATNRGFLHDAILERARTSL